MQSGIAFGNGAATSPSGESVPFVLLKLTKSVPGISEIATEGRRWRRDSVAISQKYGGDTARRARFSEEALAVIIENLRTGVGDILIARGTDGRLLGAVSYFVDAPKGFVNLVAVEPGQVPGAAPTPQQLRGVGTALVAAVSRDMLARGVTEVYLHPLDAAADRFWRGRGFETCGLGGLLCVRGVPAITALKGSCELQAENGGECLLCGTARATQRVRVG